MCRRSTPLATVAADEVARAVIGLHRDHGNRTDRRHARLKYLLADRGLEWFRDEVQSRVGFALGAAETATWPRVEDHLGWHEQGDGNLYLGVHVENGRIADTPGLSLRSAIRELVENFSPQVRLTAQQNVIFAGLSPADRSAIDGLLASHGVERAEAIHPVRLLAMACPAIPTWASRWPRARGSCPHSSATSNPLSTSWVSRTPPSP